MSVRIDPAKARMVRAWLAHAVALLGSDVHTLSRKFDMPELPKCLEGKAALPPDFKQKFTAEFPNCPVDVLETLDALLDKQEERNVGMMYRAGYEDAVRAMLVKFSDNPQFSSNDASNFLSGLLTEMVRQTDLRRAVVK